MRGKDDVAREAPQVDQIAEARRHLVEIVAYLAERSESAARRFRAAAEATFEQLAKAPGIGTRYVPDDPVYSDLRYSLVSKFRSYVVFYRTTNNGIEVVRVLHAARDMDEIIEANDEADEA